MKFSKYLFGLMRCPPGPTSKGIWDKRRSPKQLASCARSGRKAKGCSVSCARSGHGIKMRTKGLSKYPGGKNLRS